jgi:hypothetical protein
MPVPEMWPYIVPLATLLQRICRTHTKNVTDLWFELPGKTTLNILMWSYALLVAHPKISSHLFSQLLILVLLYRSLNVDWCPATHPD